MNLINILQSINNKNHNSLHILYDKKTYKRILNLIVKV
jgi:hypothetical protein